MLQLLLLLAIAGVCGSVGQQLAGGKPQGCVTAVVLGFVGAYLGRLAADSLGLPVGFTLTVGGEPFPIIWAVIGSALFVAVLSFLRGNKADR